MKKVISLLLGALLVCSLSGFTYASDPYRAYENAANRAYKLGNFEMDIVMSSNTRYADGTTDYEYSRTYSRDTGIGGDVQTVSEIEMLLNGALYSLNDHYKDGWYCEKVEGDLVYPDTGTNTRRTALTKEDHADFFWNLVYDSLETDRLAASMFSFGSDNRTINIRVPREQANDWLLKVYGRGVDDGQRADWMTATVTLDDKGNVAQEELTLQYGYPSDKGWAQKTVKYRNFFTWPADATPIVFPDDLDSYTLLIEE